MSNRRNLYPSLIAIVLIISTFVTWVFLSPWDYADCASLNLTGPVAFALLSYPTASVVKIKVCGLIAATIIIVLSLQVTSSKWAWVYSVLVFAWLVCGFIAASIAVASG